MMDDDDDSYFILSGRLDDSIVHVYDFLAGKTSVIPAGQEREVHAFFQKVRTMQGIKIRFNRARR